MNARVAWFAVVLLAGCAHPDAPAEGWTNAAARDVADPFKALRVGVARMAEMPAYAPETESLARDLVALLARPEFDPYPVARGALRPLVMHLAHPPEGGDRRAVRDEIDARMRIFPPNRD